MSIKNPQTHDDYSDNAKGWGDARAISEVYGIPQWWKQEKQFTEYEHPYPNCIVHEAEADKYNHVGGTNWLALGEKGSGKSTLGLALAHRLMEANDEAVVWRGSPDRSEWLPMKPWATICLPANADIDARWKPRDMRKNPDGEPADLENIVRKVIYYDDLRDLLSQLERHQFHVVYPDPSFTGCNEVMRESGYCPHEVEYVPRSVADREDSLKTTPLVHWWFAFCVARLEHGPYDWTSIIFDEAADLAPESARADKAQTYEKVTSLRRVMADSRKYYFSLFFFGHHEENLHSQIRRTIQWRVDMPDGTANRRKDIDSPPVGFRQIPMEQDMLSRKGPGKAICWTETNFTRFTWKDFPDAKEDRNRWLKVRTADGKSDKPSVRARTSESVAATQGGSDD